MNGFRSFSTSRIRILVFSKIIKAKNERKTRLSCLSQVMALLPGLNFSRASIFLSYQFDWQRKVYMVYVCGCTRFQLIRSTFWVWYPVGAQLMGSWISIRCFGTITVQSQQFTEGVQKWKVCYCRLTQSKPHRIPWFHVLDQAPHPHLISVGNRLIYSSKYIFSV